MKSNPRLVAMKKAFDANVAGLEYLDALAAEQGRAFTPEEQTAYDRAIAENDAAAVLLPEALDRANRYDAVATATASIGTGTAPATAPHETGRSRVSVGDERSVVTFDPSRVGQAFVPSQVRVEEMGEFALALGRAKMGKITVDQANEVLSRWDVTATEELGRVVAHGVAADGTAPVTIEGDLIKFVDGNRYAVNAARRLPMPDNHAPTFKRPRVTQFTTVAQQVTEGDILSSQRLQLTGDTVTKTTRGGVLSVSEQEIDWTEPAMLGLAIEDLATQYAIATDTVLTAAITAAAPDATETILAAAVPTATALITAITAASGVVYAASKRLGDTLFVDVNWWTRLAATVDTTGRPLFPIVGPMNGAGLNAQGVASFTGFNVLGLNVVVDPNFAADTMIVAVSSLVEFYEQNKGLLTINAPSTLEVQYAYRGYVAANVYAQGLGLIEAV